MPRWGTVSVRRAWSPSHGAMRRRTHASTWVGVVLTALGQLGLTGCICVDAFAMLEIEGELVSSDNTPIGDTTIDLQVTAGDHVVFPWGQLQTDATGRIDTEVIYDMYGGCGPILLLLLSPRPPDPPAIDRVWITVGEGEDQQTVSVAVSSDMIERNDFGACLDLGTVTVEANNASR